MLAGWKEFAFFDATPVRDPSPAESPLYSDPSLLNVVSSPSSTAFMLTKAGIVKEFSEDMQLKRQFSIQEDDGDYSPDFINIVPSGEYLVTLSSKLSSPAVLCIWDLSGPTEDAPNLHARCLISNKTNTFPPSCFVFSPDLSVVVVGFADGSVVTIRGDLWHDRGTRQRHVHSASTSITGLSLTADYNTVFVATLTQVLAISTSTKKHVTVLDKSKGADLGCATGNLGEDFVITRDTDIVFFNSLHRGPSFELVTPKKQVFLTSNSSYLVFVTIVETKNKSLLASDSVRLVVVDLKNHLIAFNQPLGYGVRCVFEAWNRINVIGQTGLMYVLREKPWQARIDLLKQRNLFQVAIQMAQSITATDKSNRNLEQMLHQDYADYLFAKNDIDASLKEYILAIDLGQTSRAIRRFKDSQYAPTLLAYLTALFESGKTSPQHVTLQIICYTKLGKLNELRKFLEIAPKQLTGFDYEAAISVLMEMHSTSYAELAALLAIEWPDPDLAVQIQLRELNSVQKCLDYIQTVSVADALRILIQNSRTMLNKLPVETTGVLITLFTGRFISRPSSSTSVDNSEKDHKAIGTQDTPILQSYQAFINFMSSNSYLGSHIVSAATLESEVVEPSYLPPRPRLIFPSFISHDNEFVIFLEACLQTAPNFSSSEKDLNDIATTLFESYLRVGSFERASQLVDEHAELLYPVNVFNVCEVFDFKLNSKQQHSLGVSFFDIFQTKLGTGDIAGALEVLKEDDQELAVLAPRHLSNNKKALDSLGPDQFLKILDAAVAAGVSHVQLISELSFSPYLSVGDIRPFITQFFEMTDEQISRHEKLANSYMAEIAQINKLTAKSKNDVTVLQYGDCSQCKEPLELPATHYLCQHSYHVDCLPNEDADCPQCLPDLETAEELRLQAEEASAQQDYFLDEMDKKNKQKTLWDFISRGALSKVM